VNRAAGGLPGKGGKEQRALAGERRQSLRADCLRAVFGPVMTLAGREAVLRGEPETDTPPPPRVLRLGLVALQTDQPREHLDLVV